MHPVFRRNFILAASLLWSALALPASAQTSSPAATVLDPESPMAPMADIGVAWPEMKLGSGPVSALPADDSASERRYSVAIDGLDKLDRAKLIASFDKLSVLRAGEGKPANTAQIARRAREDADLLDRLLRAEGYYDALVETAVEQGDGNRTVVRLTAEPGALYRFTDVQVTGIDTPETAKLRGLFGVTKDDPVNAATVLTGEAALASQISKQGFPFAKVGETQVVVDHDTLAATLTLAVDPGGARRFGRFIMSGPKPLFNAKHVGVIARFKAGDPYNQDQVDDLKRAIIATGLVSSVDLRPVQAPEESLADITVNLEPAPLRTIAGEVGYGTGEGIRAEVSWTHRNLIKPEGAVTFRGVAGTREQYLGAILRQSNWRRRDQILNASIAASNRNQPAFDAQSLIISAGIERLSNIIWQKKWTFSAGGEFLASSEQNGIQSRRTYLIGALPLMLSYDGSDDLLDPRKGFRLSLRLSPELSFQRGTFGYIRGQIDGSAYLPAGKSVVLAGRVRLGTIAGASSSQIAPSRRFYSGGGGSVRGFGYQAIGPRDPAGDPVGGRSLAEFALEARVRFGNFAVVPFLDAGSISDASLPNFSEMRYGAGIGLRYHSSFGPIRIDVGTPLNRRSGDTPVTVFVSLGQAF